MVWLRVFPRVESSILGCPGRDLPCVLGERYVQSCNLTLGCLIVPRPTFCNCRGDKPEMVTLKVELSPRAVGPFIALGLGSIVFAYHLGLCQVIYL